MCAPPRTPHLHTYIPTYYCILLRQLRCLHTYIPTYLHTYIPTYIPTYLLDPRTPPRTFPPWCILHALWQIGLLKGLKVTMSLRNVKALVLA